MGEGTAIRSACWARRNAINDEAGLPSAVCTAAGVFGTKAQSLELVAGWSYDTRNRVLFPDFGTRIGMNFNAAVPGSEVEYFVTNAGPLAIQNQQRAVLRRCLWRDDGVAAVS